MKILIPLAGCRAARPIAARYKRDYSSIEEDSDSTRPRLAQRRAPQPATALTEYERSQARDPNRFRSLYGAGEAAARFGNGSKARYYFARLVELAGAGDPRPETEKPRRYLAGH